MKKSVQQGKKHFVGHFRDLKNYDKLYRAF